MKAATSICKAAAIALPFQSTPPVKAATHQHRRTLLGYDISIHAAREGGDGKSTNKRCNRVISIHAAREGGDFGKKELPVDLNISIHAAREGGDLADMIGDSYFGHFNPRRP